MEKNVTFNIGNIKQSQNQTYLNKRAYSAKANGNIIKPAMGNPYGTDKILNSSKTFKIKFRPKAPQSNNIQNSSPHHSTKEAPNQEESLRPQTCKPLSNGFNLQRRNQILSRETDFFRNNITVFDKERLFEQLQTAKISLNSLTEENFQVKTKNLQLEKQLLKYEKIIEDFQNNGNMKSVQMKLGVETSLFLQIKKQVKDQASEIKEKTQIIEQFKRNMKVTKFQEMETEKQFLYDELQRLRKLIVAFEQEQKTQEQWINTHNQLVSNIELLKNELEKSQYDNQELGNIVIVYEERVKTLQKQLTKSNQSNQRFQKENESLRTRVKRNKNQPVEGGYFITQEEVDRINEDNNMMKQRIQDLETQIKKHQSDNRKQLEQKRPQTRQTEKEVDLLNKVPKVSQEDIQIIADEIKFSLISQGIPYQNAKDSILGKEYQRKVRINQDQIKQVLQAFPFNITDEQKLEKALRFIVETDNGDQYVYPANPQRLINTGIVKNQLNSLLEEYFLFEELEDFNQNVVQTSINQLFQEYEGKIFEKWINDLKQANYITKVQLDQLFQDTQITLQEPYNQYYYLYLFGQSSHDFSRIPTLTVIKNSQIYYQALKPFQKIVIQSQNTKQIQQNPPTDQDIYEEDFQEENRVIDDSKQQLEMLEQIQEDENSQKQESVNEAYFDDPEFEKELDEVQNKQIFFSYMKLSFQNEVLIIDDQDDLDVQKEIQQIDEQDFINYKDEYEDAAVKIQKVFRGKKARKAVQTQKTIKLQNHEVIEEKIIQQYQNQVEENYQKQNQQEPQLEQILYQVKVHESSEEIKQIQSSINPQKDLQTINKEQEDATVKIQSVFRGNQARKDFKNRKMQRKITQVGIHEVQEKNEIIKIQTEIPEIHAEKEFEIDQQNNIEIKQDNLTNDGIIEDIQNEVDQQYEVDLDENEKEKQKDLIQNQEEEKQFSKEYELLDQDAGENQIEEVFNQTNQNIYPPQQIENLEQNYQQENNHTTKQEIVSDESKTEIHHHEEAEKVEQLQKQDLEQQYTNEEHAKEIQNLDEIEGEKETLENHDILQKSLQADDQLIQPSEYLNDLEKKQHTPLQQENNEEEQNEHQNIHVQQQIEIEDQNTHLLKESLGEQHEDTHQTIEQQIEHQNIHQEALVDQDFNHTHQQDTSQHIEQKYINIDQHIDLENEHDHQDSHIKDNLENQEEPKFNSILTHHEIENQDQHIQIVDQYQQEHQNIENFSEDIVQNYIEINEHQENEIENQMDINQQHQSTKIQEIEQQELKDAAVKIQSVFRGNKARSEVKQHKLKKHGGNQDQNYHVKNSHELKLNIEDNDNECNLQLEKRSVENQLLTPISLGNNKEDIPHIDISGADEKF